MAIIKKEKVIKQETGEVLDAITFIPEVKDGMFVKVFELYSKKFMEDMGVINGEAKLFMWFVAKTINNNIQTDGWIIVDYKELAKEFNISDRTIKSYIKKLLQLKYIEQYQKRQKIFRINPDLVYKGKLWKYRKKEIEEHIKKTGTEG